MDRLTALLQAVEAERSSEEKYYTNIIGSKSIKEKVESGVVWYPVEITKKHYTIGEYVEVEVKRNPHHNFAHSFKEGAGVSLFFQGDGGDVKYSGTISMLRRDVMRIILRNDLLDKDDVPENSNTGVALVYDERPYKIMKETLNAVIKSKDEFIVRLRKGLETGDIFESEIGFSAPMQFSHLNPSQTLAIDQSLRAAEVAVIHGPPGTGKTTTLSHLVKQALVTQKRILVCAPSNNAADLLAVKIAELGISTLRFGNITRIGDRVSHLTLEEQARNTQEWKHIKKVKLQADEAEKLAKKFRRSFGSQERQERKMYREEAYQLRKWARDLEDKLSETIITNCQVVVSTLVGVANSKLDGLIFDTLVIDEASQATEPECWVPILLAKRLILCGDYKQLPPTVKSDKALSLGLGTTLLDHLANHVRFSSMLSIQYRMNDEILAFPNQYSYQGKLKSADFVKNRFLGAMPGFLFIDTAGTGFNEQFDPVQRSLKNEGEYFIIREHILQNLETIAGHTMGVIAPYSEQVRYIRTQWAGESQFKELDADINTVDGFQGQERDIIYLSLVRSNDMGEIGFLADERRLNVAITRAKMALIVIGDSASLSKSPVFTAMVSHAEETDAYKSAWEFMVI